MQMFIRTRFRARPTGEIVNVRGRARVYMHACVYVCVRHTDEYFVRTRVRLRERVCEVKHA